MPWDVRKKLLKTKDAQSISAFEKQVCVCLLCSVSPVQSECRRWGPEKPPPPPQTLHTSGFGNAESGKVKGGLSDSSVKEKSKREWQEKREKRQKDSPKCRGEAGQTVWSSRFSSNATDKAEAVRSISLQRALLYKYRLRWVGIG